MENESIGYFDFTVLLKKETLNLREISNEYEHSVDDYFLKLFSFIQLTPDAENALADFAGLKADRDAYRSIDKMATLLKDIKCKKFVSTFYTILGAYEQGNWRLAAFEAEQAAKAFNEFALEIKSAYRTIKPENAPDTALPLNEFIKCLDEEEANRKMVILAVDDSPGILISLSSVLSKEYKVFTLPKPTELEKVLKKITPDLFLLDYEMPELNGFELVSIIRNFKEHKDTPIVYLTSLGTIDNVTSALALGACDFIVKPFEPNILLGKINKWIVRKKTF